MYDNEIFAQLLTLLQFSFQHHKERMSLFYEVLADNEAQWVCEITENVFVLHAKQSWKEKLVGETV